ncbi:unnamed protein product [Mytilus coruscus]|uniref:Ig-like domain-containing protein n=1 Tax=Mytilus coruscus TaxID=42192 RepID=A0A6J8AWQ1_MYTCO|nr:unnamed protein product [Mytilus coruscus]
MSAFKQNGHRLSQKQMPASKGNDCQHSIYNVLRQLFTYNWDSSIPEIKDEHPIFFYGMAASKRKLSLHAYTCNFHVYCFKTEVSSDIIYVKENSSVILVCPFLEEKEPIIWRGPPNFKIYGINGEINRDLNNIKHKAVILKNGKRKYNLKIVMFSKNDQGFFSCDTMKDRKTVKHTIEALIAESPAGLSLVSDNSSDILTGEEGIPLKVRCYVEDDLPGPTLYLSYQEHVVNVTNTSMLEYLFVPSKNCFTCAADNEVFNVQTSILLFVQGQPECLQDNNQITSSINEDISISFNVYNPAGHLYLKYLDSSTSPITVSSNIGIHRHMWIVCTSILLGRMQS